MRKALERWKRQRRAKKLKRNAEQFCIDHQRSYRDSMHKCGYFFDHGYAHGDHVQEQVIQRAFDVLGDYCLQNGGHSQLASQISSWREIARESYLKEPQMCEHRRVNTIYSVQETDLLPLDGNFEDVVKVSDVIDAGIEATDILSDRSFQGRDFDPKMYNAKYVPLKQLYWQEERDDVEGGSIRSSEETLYFGLMPHKTDMIEITEAIFRKGGFTRNLQKWGTSPTANPLSS